MLIKQVPNSAQGNFPQIFLTVTVYILYFYQSVFTLNCAVADVFIYYC